jgi:hypothetical protein
MSEHSWEESSSQSATRREGTHLAGHMGNGELLTHGEKKRVQSCHRARSHALAHRICIFWSGDIVARRGAMVDGPDIPHAWEKAIGTGRSKRTAGDTRNEFLYADHWHAHLPTEA